MSLSMRRLVIATLSFLAWSSHPNAQELDCAVLAPAKPIQSDQIAELQIEAGGLLKKLLSGQGNLSFQGVAKDLRTDYEQSNEIYKWDSLVYLLCGHLNSAQLSATDKIAILGQLMRFDADQKISGATKELGRVAWCDDVMVELRGCAMTAGRLKCDLFAQSDAVDRDISLWGNHPNGSRIFDGQRNVYSASSVELGGESGSRYVRFKLPGKVPVRGTIYFDEMSADIQKASLMEITCTIPGRVGLVPLKFYEVTW